MKHLIAERRNANGMHPDGPLFKERRKSYYHGKYIKRTLSLLLLISCIAIVVVRQGI